MYTFISIVIMFLLGSICSHNARMKNRNRQVWFILGVLFGAIALIVLFFLPRRIPERLTPVHSTAQDGLGGAPFEDNSNEDAPLSPSSEPLVLWYYLTPDDTQVGPMSLQALKSAWVDDKVNADSYLWNESMDEWKKVVDIDNLLDKLNA